MASNIYRTPLAMSVCAAIAVSVKHGGAVEFHFLFEITRVMYTRTRVIIIIIVIRKVRKRDVFLRIFLALVCLPQTHKIYIHTL